MRCKACDIVMSSSEIIWREEEGIHEDLCKRCRNLVTDVDDELDIEYLEDYHEDIPEEE